MHLEQQTAAEADELNLGPSLDRLHPPPQKALCCAGGQRARRGGMIRLRAGDHPSNGGRAKSASCVFYFREFRHG
jgi:hypothetical protein